MIRGTPFHQRTSELNQTSLWSHWAGYAVPVKYQMAEKVEYFAVRNAAGLFDTSPLFKYRIWGRNAEAHLARLLARDVRRCRPNRAQYTMWCDARGFLQEDGIVLRIAPDEFWLTSAEPNLAYLQSMDASVEIDDVSGHYGILALQGPSSLSILSSLSPEVVALGPFDLMPAKIGSASVLISRTGYTGDLGYEIWSEEADTLRVWDTVTEAGRPWGLVPYGGLAMHMLRLEAGLLLIDVDYASSRYAWTDEQRATPVELGYGWMFRNLERDDRAFIGREAVERELNENRSRFRLVGLIVDWRHHESVYRAQGLPPSKEHVPVEEEMMVYADGHVVGFSSSFMYSPLLQRHIALARVPTKLATPGSTVELEVTINHRNHRVAATVVRPPFYTRQNGGSR